MAQKKKEKLSKNLRKIILKQIEKAQTSPVKAKPSPPLKLSTLKIKPEKLEEKIEQFSPEQISPSPTPSSQAIPAPLRSSPSSEVAEASIQNYSSQARAKKYASQRTERPASQETAPRTAESEQTPYSTIVLYSGAKQQTTETARAYTPGESVMRRATQMANRLANRVPQIEINQNEMFENKLPNRTPQNAPEKVYSELTKPEDKKPKRRYPWEG